MFRARLLARIGCCSPGADLSAGRGLWCRVGSEVGVSGAAPAGSVVGGWCVLVEYVVVVGRQSSHRRAVCARAAAMACVVVSSVHITWGPAGFIWDVAHIVLVLPRLVVCVAAWLLGALV